jgi:hypothetical protein
MALSLAEVEPGTSRRLRKAQLQEEGLKSIDRRHQTYRCRGGKPAGAFKADYRNVVSELSAAQRDVEPQRNAVAIPAADQDVL